MLQYYVEIRAKRVDHQTYTIELSTRCVFNGRKDRKLHLDRTWSARARSS